MSLFWGVPVGGVVVEAVMFPTFDRLLGTVKPLRWEESVTDCVDVDDDVGVGVGVGVGWRIPVFKYNSKSQTDLAGVAFYELTGRYCTS